MQQVWSALGSLMVFGYLFLLLCWGALVFYVFHMTSGGEARPSALSELTPDQIEAIRKNLS